MIDLYYWPTPNGHKVPIFLEEAEIPYVLKPVALNVGAQFSSEFQAISPNSKIPAIVDHRPLDRAKPIPIFESGAILLYLAEKTHRFLSLDFRKRSETLQWLFWQTSALCSMSGHEHLFAKEVERLLGVLNYKLGQGDFIVGDYSIADMATYPWVIAQPSLAQYPNLKKWAENIGARPAVQRAYDNAKKV